MKEQKLAKKVEDLLIAPANGNVFSDVISQTERVLIEKALKRAFGNQSIAAKLLGISRNTLRVKIRKLNIDVTMFRI